MRVGDLNWTLTPLVSFLFTFGGWQYKGVRRIGVPIALCLYGLFYYGHEVKKNLLCLLSLFLSVYCALTLPLTAFGDKMNLTNVSWAFLLGYIYIIVLYPLTQLKRLPEEDTNEREVRWFVSSYICAIIYGLSITLSFFFNGFEHKWTEIIAGLCIGFSAAYILKYK